MGSNLNSFISKKFIKIMGKLPSTYPVAKNSVAKKADATLLKGAATDEKQKSQKQAATNLSATVPSSTKLPLLIKDKALVPNQLLLQDKKTVAYAKANAKLNVTLPSSGEVYVLKASPKQLAQAAKAKLNVTLPSSGKVIVLKPSLGSRIKASLLGALVATQNATLSIIGALLGPALFVYDKLIQKKIEASTSKAIAKQNALLEQSTSTANKKAFAELPGNETATATPKTSQAFKNNNMKQFKAVKAKQAQQVANSKLETEEQFFDAEG